MWKSTVFAVVLLLASVCLASSPHSKHSHGLTCHNCSTELHSIKEGKHHREEFAKESASETLCVLPLQHNTKTVMCPEGHFCYRVEEHTMEEHESITKVVRGCAPENYCDNYPKKSCSKCKTDLCNDARIVYGMLGLVCTLPLVLMKAWA